MVFALIGNPNSGKTTLFNQLTGSKQHVGNFPGVTVDRKEGPMLGYGDTVVVDLPGIYSLSPYSMEELVTRDFLLQERPDAIINIVDAASLERSLYLSLQLLELGLPMIVALNRMDAVQANGMSIEVRGLSEALGVPMVPIAASRGMGVEELAQRAVSLARERELPRRGPLWQGKAARSLQLLAHTVQDSAAGAGLSRQFAAAKLLEGDSWVESRLRLSEQRRAQVRHIVGELESAVGMDRAAALADMRYTVIEGLCKEFTVRQGESREQRRTLAMDRWLTHRYFAIPIFLGIMGLVFWLTFGVVGGSLSGLLAEGVGFTAQLVDGLLIRLQVAPMLRALLMDAVFAGVGSVLGFLPTIVTLFFFLSLLEDSGYMARVAFIMDQPLRKIGLSGRSFVPMVMGFGCSVPAVMASRALASERNRRMTILLTPFMSCSAKLPIYSIFTAAFFPAYAAQVMLLLYAMGIAAAVLSGWFLRKTVFQGASVPFVMELPTYRLPTVKSVLLHMWQRAEEFIKKAFTIVFLTSLVVWGMQNFNLRLQPVENSAESILASLGLLLAPLFRPLGFGDWRAATALLTGLMAKETVVSTLAVLLNAGEPSALGPLLSGLFTPLSAFSFLTFTLLYMPCVAAVTAMRRELGGMGAAGAMAYQTTVAWLAAFAVYQVGGLLGL